jgi:hypothetical protein
MPRKSPPAPRSLANSAQRKKAPHLRGAFLLENQVKSQVLQSPLTTYITQFEQSYHYCNAARALELRVLSSINLPLEGGC